MVRQTEYAGSDDRRWSSHAVRSLIIAAAVLAACSSELQAQPQYSNTSLRRPLHTEDAGAVERYVLDAHISPASLTRAGRAYSWSVEPGITYGLLPRTQIDLSLLTGQQRWTGTSEEVIAGIDASILYALNVETQSFPALAVRGRLTTPLAGSGLNDARPSVRAIATRSFRWGRAHFNQEYTFGSGIAPTQYAGVGKLDRWTSSLAVDRTFPLRGIILGAEARAGRGLQENPLTQWSLAAGARYQVLPRVTIDLGVAKFLTGDHRGWQASAGVGRAFSVRRLIPGLGPWGNNE